MIRNTKYRHILFFFAAFIVITLVALVFYLLWLNASPNKDTKNTKQQKPNNIDIKCSNITKDYSVTRKKNKIDSKRWSKINRTHFFYIDDPILGIYSFDLNITQTRITIGDQHSKNIGGYCKHIFLIQNKIYIVCDYGILELDNTATHITVTNSTIKDLGIVKDAKYDNFSNSLIIISKRNIYKFEIGSRNIKIFNTLPIQEELEAVVTYNKMVYLATVSQEVYRIRSDKSDKPELINIGICQQTGSHKIQLYADHGYLWVGCNMNGLLRIYKYDLSDLNMNSIKKCIHTFHTNVIHIINIENELDILTTTGIEEYIHR